MVTILKALELNLLSNEITAEGNESFVGKLFCSLTVRLNSEKYRTRRKHAIKNVFYNNITFETEISTLLKRSSGLCNSYE
jgi:hypothetical protein